MSAIADHINEVLGEGIDKAYKAGIKAVVTNNIKWLKGSKDKPAFNKFAEDLDITVDPKTGKVVTIKKKKKPLNPLFDVSYTETDMKAIYNFRVEAFTVAQIGEYDLQEDLKGLAEKTVLEHNSDPSYFVKEAQRMANRYIRGDWLETNFNTAVGSSYRAAEWIRLQDPAIKDIYPAYQYKTRGDSRVRDEHRALADKVYRNTDPLWSKVWPPNGWNCRCYAIPLDTDDLSSGQYKVEDMMRSKEEEKAIIDATFKTKDEKKYFARNSGETKSIWGKWINEKFKDMPADVKAEIKGRVKNYAKGLTSEIVKDSGGKVAEAVTEKVVSKFVPAKTVQEAEEKIKSLGVEDVNFEGLTLQKANSVAEAMTTEFNNNSLKGFRGITTDKTRNSEAVAVYIPEKKRIVINLSQMRHIDKKYFAQSWENTLELIQKDIDKIMQLSKGSRPSMFTKWGKRLRLLEFEAKEIKSKLEAGIKPRVYNAADLTDSPEEKMRFVIHHEVGHHRHYQSGHKTNNFEFSKTRAISDYGAKDADEYYAEWYAYYRHFGEKDIPEDLLKLFKEIDNAN